MFIIKTEINFKPFLSLTKSLIYNYGFYSLNNLIKDTIDSHSLTLICLNFLKYITKITK